ncbi:Oidioi.mRNA.OKI2018_I69.PAR.g10679.t1.cds [Oikopleura dioica]|uniref:Oidioi.mRNA.OKI2018_I69.PAR.g10679.t1.cds n=1 Tax=Oikopleura dioica TaxID=34765 RepID=A0ABN7RXH3_OIKDI|nr:Oidioi.mRNA.OKI2018_I69.PAR.g10679.t1.cds [Oikopleura dioica]
MLNYEEKRAYTVDLWDPGTMLYTGKIEISVQDVDEFFPVVKNANNNIVSFTTPWVISRRTKIGTLEFTDNDGGKYSIVKVYNYEDDLTVPRKLEVDDDNNVFFIARNFSTSFKERFIASSGDRRTVFSIKVMRSNPPNFFLWSIPVVILVAIATAAFLMYQRKKDHLDEIRTASDPTPDVYSREKICNLVDDSNSETVQISQTATTKFLTDDDLPIMKDYISSPLGCRFEQNYFVVTTPVSKFLSDSDSDSDCSENCDSHRGNNDLTTLRRGGSIQNGELHI